MFLHVRSMHSVLLFMHSITHELFSPEKQTDGPLASMKSCCCCFLQMTPPPPPPAANLRKLHLFIIFFLWLLWKAIVRRAVRHPLPIFTPPPSPAAAVPVPVRLPHSSSLSITRDRGGLPPDPWIAFHSAVPYQGGLDSCYHHSPTPSPRSY